MVVFSEANAFAKICFPQRLIEPGHEMDAALPEFKEVAPVAHQTVRQDDVSLGKQARQLTKEGDLALSFAGIFGRRQIDDRAARKGEDCRHPRQRQATCIGALAQLVLVIWGLVNLFNDPLRQTPWDKFGETVVVEG